MNKVSSYLLPVLRKAVFLVVLISSVFAQPGANDPSFNVADDEIFLKEKLNNGLYLLAAIDENGRRVVKRVIVGQ